MSSKAIMEVEAFDQHFDVFKTSYSSSRPSRHMSSPQTPPDAQHAFDEYTASQHIMNGSEEDYETEDGLLPDPVPSGRSSISSFPASIIHHEIRPSQSFPYDYPHTPAHSRRGTPTLPQQYMQQHAKSSNLITGFRNPSSVRALQMQDELSDEDFTPGHKRRASRMSYVSYRSGSTHSTPGKRMSRSLQGSPVKSSSKLRKEFPLVLLHCTLLPSMISPKIKTVSEELLEAIIPEPYKKRWKLLQEKVLRNFEVRERGVLIPHPREDYDMLEERLLESLELENPVINNGHFVGRSDSRASAADSGFGSEENSSRGDVTEEEAEEEHRCIDCGGHICGDKKWEVKVYAANGLMKSGAWAAAWSEMEKVDVQVSVWLPEDISREIEARLDAVIAQEQQLQEEELLGKGETANDERTKEIYGEGASQKKQEEIDGLTHGVQQPPNHSPRERPAAHRQSSQEPAPFNSEKVDLQVALLNYFRLTMQDSRNMAILMLSILLFIYAMNRQQDPLTNDLLMKPIVETIHETQVEYLTTTVVTTSTATAIETSTITETTQTLASILPASGAVSSTDPSAQAYSFGPTPSSMAEKSESTSIVPEFLEEASSICPVRDARQSLMSRLIEDTATDPAEAMPTQSQIMQDVPLANRLPTKSVEDATEWNSGTVPKLESRTDAKEEL